MYSVEFTCNRDRSGRALGVIMTPGIGIVLLLAATAAQEGVEAWADPALPASPGLHLWLDATRIDARDGEQVLLWRDGSGRKRPLAAPNAEQAPRMVHSGSAASLRFDGRDDRMGIRGLDLSLREYTTLVVVAAHSNAGGFHGFLSSNAPGKNDYTTGFNLDLGGAGGALSSLNAEGAGFSGERNLLARTLPFGRSQLVAITSTPGKDGVRLRVGGVAAGSRERAEGTAAFAEIHVGARHYSNSQAPTSDQGFFHGDVAEVLLYGRILAAEELEKVEGYLLKKHQALLEGKLLAYEPPPPITMLVPGFTVRELPVKLTNINNVEYAPDGRLIALGYDGRIHALTDTDGDGLEDQVKPWWYQGEGDFRGPIGMVIAREGIYVASKGKVTLVRDTDGDGTGDTSEVVATGWKEIAQAVDTVGLALDKDGSLYFGLGCTNFANAFLLDKEGKAHYDVKSERGTVQKLAPDRKSRQTVCTGVRFPVGMAMNRHGDLFATDQEGETWMPNGNPLDELLHILPGRNYGFPPPHPQHNAGVIDEGALVTFGPQHQSTCGIKFNESGTGRSSFGPPAWEGDALIIGESRGKLWRVPLVKTPHGYVGRHFMIASLSMLAIDPAVSPKGDLVVTCHSGPPDWGTGPKGEGRLFKISWTGRAAAQPVAAWPSGPLEVKVAFDRALDAGAKPEAAIVFGEYVGAGDRHETLRPPYKVLEEQARSPRVAMKVAGAALSGDRRTLTLTTASHPWLATYAVTVKGATDVPVDLAYDLSGAEASWTPEGVADPAWSGWVPHPDPEVVRAFLRGSAEHERYLDFLSRPGRLSLRWQAVLPGKRARVGLSSNAAFTVTWDRLEAKGPSVEIAADVTAEPAVVAVEVRTGGAPLEFRAWFRPEGDPFTKALRPEHFRIPWAAPHRPPRPAAKEAASPLGKGDWSRGKALFTGEAKCSQCHSLRGEGGKAAPDLSNLIHWDPARILKDIVEPNATINPDYVNHLVELKDGRRLAGVILTEGSDRLRIVDAEAKETIVSRGDVKQLKPSSLSIMPEGLKALGDGKLADLLEFLSREKP